MATYPACMPGLENIDVALLRGLHLVNDVINETEAQWRIFKDELHQINNNLFPTEEQLQPSNASTQSTSLQSPHKAIEKIILARDIILLADDNFEIPSDIK